MGKLFRFVRNYCRMRRDVMIAAVAVAVAVVLSITCAFTSGYSCWIMECCYNLWR